MTCYVYHICREGDKFDFSKGYVGISSDPSYRWMRHKKWEKSGRLKLVYKKYQDIIEYILVQGSREYCLMVENKLRPCKRIGWNIEEGGGMPPSHAGKKMSLEQKKRISEANKSWQRERKNEIWVCDGKEFISKLEASEYFGVTRKTIKDRCDNPKYTTWFRRTLK